MRFARRRPPWWALALPSVLLPAVLVLYPAFETVRLSFVSWDGFGREDFVGIDNYVRAVSDSGVARAVTNSLTFAATVTIGTVGLGTAFALAIDRAVHGAAAFRFLLVVPIMLPSTFLALVWRHGFDPYYGWVNSLLEAVHIPIPSAWLGDPSIALYVVATSMIIQGVGLPMVLVVAALGEIPTDVHEATTLDGATPWQRARWVSVPLVKPLIAAVAAVQFLSTYAVFDWIYVMTRGGPGTASDVVGTFVYRTAFVDHQFGYGAAMAVISTVLLTGGVLVGLTWLRRGPLWRR
jgi:ABC-type sugar transport system permease subunit